jgi:DNA excision repair protein ERCC-4
MDTTDITILIDNREQRPLSFGGTPTQRTMLTTGDYSCISDGKDLREVVSIERKSVADLLSCIGGERERFERELVRLGTFAFRALVIEGEMRDLIDASKSSNLHPQAVIGSVLAWTFKFGVPPIFCPDSSFAAATVRRLLVHAARYAEDFTLPPIGQFVRNLMVALRPVQMGLCYVDDALARGREKHPDGDGFREPASFHIDRARMHLEALAAGDTTEPHLANAAARLLIALEQLDEPSK